MPIFENFPVREQNASTVLDGLMSKEDKTKLEGIEAGANKYVHPVDETHRHATDTQIAQWSDNTVYTNDMPTVNALGGIAAGQTFDGMPINQLLTKLLYPYVAPVVSASSTPNGGVYEKGTSVSVSQITVSVAKKSENITKVEVFDGSRSLGVKTEATTGNVIFPLDAMEVSTNKSFTVKVTDAANKVVTKTTGGFTFVYPFFQGVIAEDGVADEGTVTGLTKLVQTKADKSINFTATNQRMVFAFPKAYGALKTILDPNSFDVTDTWTGSEITITTADNLKTAYYVYVSKPVTVTSYKMQFKF